MRREGWGSGRSSQAHSPPLWGGRRGQPELRSSGVSGEARSQRRTRPVGAHLGRLGAGAERGGGAALPSPCTEWGTFPREGKRSFLVLLPLKVSLWLLTPATLPGGFLEARGGPWFPGLWKEATGGQGQRERSPDGPGKVALGQSGGHGPGRPKLPGESRQPSTSVCSARDGVDAQLSVRGRRQSKLREQMVMSSKLVASREPATLRRALWRWSPFIRCRPQS